jgi:hypothetical protein
VNTLLNETWSSFQRHCPGGKSFYMQHSK